MDWWQIVVLGIVEGVTEFLPVSSTGHLILTARILDLPSGDFLKTFDIAIQSGAILAVIVLYGRRLLHDRPTLKRVAAAFLPTVAVGLAAYRFVKSVLLGNVLVVLWALLIGGAVIVLFEKYYQRRAARQPSTQMTYGQAVCIGLFQSLAMIPGVSRSAATILGGLALGLERKTIVEFSFLLAVPTMLAATGYDLLKSSHAFTGNEWGFLAVGFVVSFVVAVYSIKFLLLLIKRHSFEVFGYYRIGLAVLFLWLLR